MSVFATSLRKKLGIQENDVVGALLPNSPEFAVVALGTIQAGCIFSPVNPIYKECKINNIINSYISLISTSRCISHVAK